MLRIVSGVFIVLHGLVHMWYFTLSRRWVEFRPEMGWNGRSWLFSALLGDAVTRALASAFYALAALGLLVSGIALIASAAWWRVVGMVSAVLSGLVIMVFWDGDTRRIVEKGLIGLFINAAIVVVLAVAG